DRARHFGHLAHLPIKAIEREIDRLVAAGYLETAEAEFKGQTYYTISVTAAGLVKEPAPPPPLRRTGSGEVSVAARRQPTAVPTDREEIFTNTPVLPSPAG